ncbi:hypothetical protein HC891_09265 [Candidatus Gracilibacteria bacterium]|nr:hypothetical protein [Candidatus Gracilibacteria bacterium]
MHPRVEIGQAHDTDRGQQHKKDAERDHNHSDKFDDRHQLRPSSIKRASATVPRKPRIATMMIVSSKIVCRTSAA